jgi:hypothetical protein
MTGRRRREWTDWARLGWDSLYKYVDCGGLAVVDYDVKAKST